MPSIPTTPAEPTASVESPNSPATPVNNTPTNYNANPTGRKKMLAAILNIVGGVLGAGNFYLGKTTRAMIQLAITVLWLMICIPLTLAINNNYIFIVGPAASFVWGVVEGALILAAKPGTAWHKDGRGAELADK
jgi:TM2 domain-containing membrane protein YozV